MQSCMWIITFRRKVILPSLGSDCDTNWSLVAFRPVSCLAARHSRTRKLNRLNLNVNKAEHSSQWPVSNILVWTMKMEATWSSEKLVCTYKIHGFAAQKTTMDTHHENTWWPEFFMWLANTKRYVLQQNNRSQKIFLFFGILPPLSFFICIGSDPLISEVIIRNSENQNLQQNLELQFYAIIQNCS
jgi:hypothetical protein